MGCVKKAFDFDVGYMKVVSEGNDLFLWKILCENFLFWGARIFSFVTSQEFPFHSICVIITRFFYLQNSYEEYDNLQRRIWTRAFSDNLRTL